MREFWVPTIPRRVDAELHEHLRFPNECVRADLEKRLRIVDVKKRTRGRLSLSVLALHCQTRKYSKGSLQLAPSRVPRAASKLAGAEFFRQIREPAVKPRTLFFQTSVPVF